jgi:uncharacterized protein
MSDFSHGVTLSEAKHPQDASVRTSGFFASLRMTGLNVFARPAQFLSGLVWLYQKTFSPVLAAVAPTCGCRFAPTCSHYAREALREHGLVTGVALSARRLLKCGPWHPGGFDPVPLSPSLQRTESSPKFSCVSVGKTVSSGN